MDRLRLAGTAIVALIGLSILGEQLLRPEASVRPVHVAQTARPLAAAIAGGLLIPVDGVQRAALRDSFAAQRKGHIHAAIDILAPRGTPVRSATDGIVTKLRVSSLGGLTVYIHDDAGVEYYYAHLDHYDAFLHEGMRVHRGEVIAYVGTTGNAPPQTPHLHFAIEQNGSAVDPYPLLMGERQTLSLLR